MANYNLPDAFNTSCEAFRHADKARQAYLAEVQKQKQAHNDFTHVLEEAFLDYAQQTDGTARSIANAITNCENLYVSPMEVAAYGRTSTKHPTMRKFKSNGNVTISETYVRLDDNGNPDMSHKLTRNRTVMKYK